MHKSTLFSHCTENSLTIKLALFNLLGGRFIYFVFVFIAKVYFSNF